MWERSCEEVRYRTLLPQKFLPVVDRLTLVAGTVVTVDHTPAVPAAERDDVGDAVAQFGGRQDGGRGQSGVAAVGVLFRLQGEQRLAVAEGGDAAVVAGFDCQYQHGRCPFDLCAEGQRLPCRARRAMPLTSPSRNARVSRGGRAQCPICNLLINPRHVTGWVVLTGSPQED